MDTNLRARIVAALVLIPVVVAVVLQASSGWFAAFVGLFVVAAAWEWSALAGAPRALPRTMFAAAVGLCLAVSHAYPGDDGWLLWLAAVYWAVITGAMVCAQAGATPRWIDEAAFKWAAGWIVLVPAWWALCWLRDAPLLGAGVVLLVMVIVWGADIGAYFAGRKFGRHRLANRISPGKTWEGAAGGLAVAAIAAVVFWWSSPLQGVSFPEFFVLCLLTGMVSIIGDLSESLFKRRAGVKDSGGMIPGHGGVLDRIDSITAAAPFFALGARLLGLQEGP